MNMIIFELIQISIVFNGTYLTYIKINTATCGMKYVYFESNS